MKFSMAMIVALCLAGTAQAQTDVVLSQRTVNLQVDISTARVKLSRAGYSVPLVKVLVPALADVTLLNHRNEGEGAPCLATYETSDPAAVVQGRPEVEEIPFTITLTKSLYPDEANKTCKVTLIEGVTGKVRGFEFVHYRTQFIGERNLEDCR